MVEFAIILPLLVIVVFGIIEFGRAYNTKITLTHAAREGVREYALTQNSSNGQDAAEAAATGLDLTQLERQDCQALAELLAIRDALDDQDSRLFDLLHSPAATSEGSSM